MNWLRRFDDGPGTPVVVFGPAGGGCLRLRAAADRMPDGLRLVGVQLPGREDRAGDPHPSGIGEVVRAVHDELTGVEGLYLAGVSLGALLAFELARALEAGGGPRCDGLLVAAAGEPGAWARYRARFPGGVIPETAADALLPPAVRGSALRDYAASVLLADLALTEGHDPSGAVLDRTPLTSVSGARDTVVDAAAMRGWGTRSRAFRGHHELDAAHHEFTEPSMLGRLAALAVAGVPT